jgi:hypothetical protein
MNHRAKYRPYFTLAELTILRDSLQSAAPTQSGLLRYLSRFIRDITDGLREPNHVGEPTLEETLGFSSIVSVVQESPKNLYEAWINNIPLTPAQITLMNQYRYENDLMSTEEEEQFVAQLMEKT